LSLFGTELGISLDKRAYWELARFWRYQEKIFSGWFWANSGQLVAWAWVGRLKEGAAGFNLISSNSIFRIYHRRVHGA